MTLRKDTNSSQYLIISGIMLVFCLLFMILFRIELPKKTIEEGGEDLELFYMVPDADTASEQMRQQAEEDNLDLIDQQARNFYDDPTLMSFPNMKYGFSSIRTENDEPPPPAVSGYNLPLSDIKTPEKERVPLVGIYPDPAVNDPGNYAPPEIGKIEVEKINREYRLRIIWLENGREIECPVKADIALKAAGDKIPVAPTKIKIEKLSSGPVQFLVNKCGVPALDKLVMDHFTQMFAKVFTGQLKATSLPDTILVDWRLVIRPDKN